MRGKLIESRSKSCTRLPRFNTKNIDNSDANQMARATLAPVDAGDVKVVVCGLLDGSFVSSSDSGSLTRGRAARDMACLGGAVGLFLSGNLHLYFQLYCILYIDGK